MHNIVGFSSYLVSEDSSTGYAPSRAERIRDLSKAVLGQEHVIKAISSDAKDDQVVVLTDILSEKLEVEI
jgi:hypothetical protein